MTPGGLVLLGCGGHARSAADIALAAGIGDLLFVDGQARPGERILGFPAVRALDALPDGWRWLPALGDNTVRERQLHAWPQSALHTLVAPGAHVGNEVALGPGVLIGHFCHVGPRARVGDGTIVNNGAIVEHDCRIGRCCHVSVHATLAGGATLGDRVFIGAGATVIDAVTIGNDVVVGAGATVVDDLATPGTYAGTPARPLHR
jgi:UDP-N-acetylbacillosamine N-acetyltransferase